MHCQPRRRQATRSAAKIVLRRGEETYNTTTERRHARTSKMNKGPTNDTDEKRIVRLNPPPEKMYAAATCLQRDDDGDDAASGKTLTDSAGLGPGPRREHGYLSIPATGKAKAEQPASTAAEDNDRCHDHTKDCFSCSSSSAALSSTRSVSSASGILDSPLLMSQSFRQAFTPLSMGGSDIGAEDGDAAIRKLVIPDSSPPAPPNPCAERTQNPELAELVTLNNSLLITEGPQFFIQDPRTSSTHENKIARSTNINNKDGDNNNCKSNDNAQTTRTMVENATRTIIDGGECGVQESGGGDKERNEKNFFALECDYGCSAANSQGVSGGPAATATCHHKQESAASCPQNRGATQHSQNTADQRYHLHLHQSDDSKCHPTPTLPLFQAQHSIFPTHLAGTTGSRTSTGALSTNDPSGSPSTLSNSPYRVNLSLCGGLADATGATPDTLDPARPENPKPDSRDGQCTPEGEDDNNKNLVSCHRATFSPNSNSAVQSGGNPNKTSTTTTNINNANPNSQNNFSAATAPGSNIASHSVLGIPLSLTPPTSYSSPLSIISQQQSNQQGGNPQPLIRTTSDNRSLTIQHPVPDINPKSGAYLGNIAQLEATAERLSTSTSSIEDAIRDLHAELKRSDSQRSAIARFRAGQPLFATEETEIADSQLRLVRPALFRHLSASASIASRNSTSSRHPPSRSRSNSSINQPLRYRRRSGSLNTAMQQHNREEFESYLSRTGPGKGSVRSVRTGKLSLAEIVESEPVSLTQDALDEADRTNMTEEDDDTIRGQTAYEDNAAANDSVPQHTNAFHAMLDGSGLDLPSPELALDPTHLHPDHPSHYGDQRPRSSGSTTSSINLKNAFGDFDGVHFQPELYSPPPEMQAMAPPPPPQAPMSPPRALRSSISPPLPRPTSYMDPQTGQEMLYYPARVPAMLNLPPKLSKKPKAASRNTRQSHLLNAMPETSRKSAVWLPDPLQDQGSPAFSPPLSLDESMAGILGQVPQPESPFADTGLPTPGSAPEIQVTETPDGQSAAAATAATGDQAQAIPAADNDEVQPAVPRPRKSAAIETDARKSRLSKLPPQLRASVFFDLPSTFTKLKVKDGSATATLDGLLDASANAPVSAFTDHLIAGKLGAEVYGPEKKRKSDIPKTLTEPKTSSDSDPKKRHTFLRSKKSSDALDSEKRTSDVSPASGSFNDSSGPPVSNTALDDEPLPPGAVGYATLSPDTDEFDDADRKPKDGEQLDGKEEGEEEEEEYDEMYHGPPTTLLAELQIRKQQQKNRTRPMNNPNGMHSTLLQMDAVAEAQRRNRKGKRVNLAWEDPDLDAQGDESDEDVPLGVLYAAKAAGINDLAAATAELDRPLGLMERRELEENEPLSRRRARLQGNDPHQSAILTKRQTLLMNAGVNIGGGNRLSQLPSVGNMGPQLGLEGRVEGGEQEEDAEEEVEGETLGERMRRLKNKEDGDNPLPRARPVSTAFTSELLSQFGDPAEDNEKEKDKKEGEEEETLGQRRRRLQAEREAEMGFSGARPVSQLMPPGGSGVPANHRLSMAGILSAHPMKDTSLQDAERRRHEEDMRLQRAQEERMAAMRAQMPTTLATPNTGIQSGAFRNGQFNDGTGGTGSRRVPSQSNIGAELGPDSWNRSSVAFTNGGMIQQAGVTSMKGPYGAGQYNGATGGWYGQAPVQMQAPMQMPMQMPMGMQMPIQMPMQTPMQTPMQMAGMAQPMGMPMGMGGGYPMMNPQGQADMVERWRRSVMP